MTKNPSDRNRPGDTYQTDRDQGKQEPQQRKGGSMASKQAGQKFVSDEDIVGRTDYRQVRYFKRMGKEPKFLSDEDIIRRRAG
jgi:hypothetical protein